MPVIEAHVLEGYSEEERQRLARALTDAACLVIPAAPDAVTVMIRENPKANYMRGGKTRAPAPARPDPCEQIRAYLAAMEARDMHTARSMLADGFVMNFPAAPGLTALEELIAWAAPRYRFVKKTYDQFEAFQKDRVTVIYAMGTLYGEWPNGAPFEDIRFIDRFEMTDGKITRQDVWNDMAETKAQLT
ncbi:nuclear transport factor 2 family protein [Hoeflea sp.]|uniref:nuclear transport factor 2 family protein n=1 Tax=Hoeflea sp. TaxID=1940281 RepID=UPI00374987B4